MPPEKTKKSRADLLLVKQNLAPTRTRAQSLILAGVVYAGTQRVDKASELFSSDTILTVKGEDHPYVSRGGLKLKAALDHFQISVKDKTCLDVGASTGGFTDCLLKEGAKKVYAIDVGYGQLDWKLQTDARVVMMDRLNFRHLDIATIPEKINLVTIDVSFISLTNIIPKVLEFKPQTIIALIKPQFEAGKEGVGKKGIVRDENIRRECVQKIVNFCTERGVTVNGTIPSPITGQDGNHEFLLVTG